MASRHLSAEEVVALLEDPDQDEEGDDPHEVVTQDSDDELEAEYFDEAEGSHGDGVGVYWGAEERWEDLFPESENGIHSKCQSTTFINGWVL